MDSGNNAVASIIIVTYNGMPYLDACLNSILSTVPHDTELVVIDNGSTDGSADFVERTCSNATVIRNNANSGFAAACNTGAQHAVGNVLVYLNQDTVVSHGWLSSMVEMLQRNIDVGLVTSKLLLMSDPEKVNACGQHVHFSGLIFLRGFLENVRRFNDPEAVDAVHGAAFAIRKELWNELGGFDEDFFMYYEETDLSWRAQLTGYRCVCVPDSVVLHDYQAGSSSASALYYAKRNRYITLLKNWRLQTLLLLLPSLLVAEILDWAHTVLAHEQGWQIKLKANHSVFTALPQILRKRKIIQDKRTKSDSRILERRDYRLSPSELKGGIVGTILVVPMQILFWANYQFVRLVCRFFSW